MKTVYVKKGGGLRSNDPWIVVAEGEGHPLQVEDDIEAPLGYVWDRDHKSQRPTFTAPDGEG